MWVVKDINSKTLVKHECKIDAYSWAKEYYLEEYFIVYEED